MQVLAFRLSINFHLLNCKMCLQEKKKKIKKLPLSIIKHNENQLENLHCKPCWESCTTDHCLRLPANFQASHQTRGHTFSMLCVSVGVACTCITLLDVVTQQAPRHITAGESGHGVSWESRARFAARRNRPEAGMDEEQKKRPSLRSWGMRQL